MTTGDYHGIVIGQSQRDRSIFEELDVIGTKKMLFGLVVLYKIRVSPEEIEAVVTRIQDNMSSRFWFRKQEFYAHFYRENELIIVYRDRTFKATPDRPTWGTAIEHGKSLGILEKQLDFIPNRFEDETF